MKNLADPITQNLTSVILCGGKGSRLNNQNKPLVEWKGKPLIEYVAESLPRCTEKLISANRDITEYEQYGSVVKDSITGFESETPLVGILAALDKMSNDWLICAPGDTPRLEQGWVEQLLIAASNRSLIYVKDPLRSQPLHSLIHVSEKTHLRSYLSQGRKSATNFLNLRKAKAVEFYSSDMFSNFNSAEDFV